MLLIEYFLKDPNPPVGIHIIYIYINNRDMILTKHISSYFKRCFTINKMKTVH